METAYLALQQLDPAARQRVRVFIDALTAAGFPVDECDERFSTVEAEETLLEADLSTATRARVTISIPARSWH